MLFISRQMHHSTVALTVAREKSMASLSVLGAYSHFTSVGCMGVHSVFVFLYFQYAMFRYKYFISIFFPRVFKSLKILSVFERCKPLHFEILSLSYPLCLSCSHWWVYFRSTLCPHSSLFPFHTACFCDFMLADLWPFCLESHIVF